MDQWPALGAHQANVEKPGASVAVIVTLAVVLALLLSHWCL